MMKASILLDIKVARRIGRPISKVLELEACSSPPGGMTKVSRSDGKDLSRILIEMTSEELSTSRAMLNSYMGLLEAAVDTVASR